MLNTPILFLGFNRPKLTERVLAAIRQARPSRLFVAADGPRPAKPGDYEKCQAVRNVLRDGIDWECQVRTLLRDQNLGCKRAVSSAITWFFEQVEEGIILEDDTLPVPDFFPYCQTLLQRYRDNQGVMHISGNNFQFGRKWGRASYYFSIYNHNWGWASWRRAWQCYDANLTSYPAHRQDERWLKWLSGPAERDYWRWHFDKVHRGEIDTWDYQWTFSVLINNGLTILPDRNLVQNIGFRGDATHTKEPNSFLSLPAEEMEFPLRHPSLVAENRKADERYFRWIFWNRIKKKLKL